MFVVILRYKKALEIVEKHLSDHRNFLEQWYQKNSFVASGPMNPRVGGIIISQLTDREQLMAILEQDPFNIHGVADYEVMEFSPVKYHVDFAKFI